jgi:hypothetical protein
MRELFAWVGLAAALAAAGCTTTVARPPAVTPPGAPEPTPPPIPQSTLVLSPSPLGQRPIESARLQAPAWLRLEALSGASDNLHHPHTVGAAFAADGQTLVTAGRDGTVRVWDLATRLLRADVGACLAAQPDYGWAYGATTLALSPDGLAAVGFAGGKVCIVELANGRLLRIIAAHDAHIVQLVFVGRRLISYGSQERFVAETSIGPIVEQREAGGETRWWDPLTGAKLSEVTLGRASVLAIALDGAGFATLREHMKGIAAFAPDGRKLWERTDVVGQSAFTDHGTLLVAGRKGLVALDIDRKRTETTAFFPAPDGKRALALHYEHLAGYDLTTGARLWQADGDAPYQCALLPDSQAFVSHHHARIRLRSLATGMDIGPPLALKGLPGHVNGFAVSPDGRMMLLWTSEGILLRFAIDPTAAADP